MSRKVYIVWNEMRSEGYVTFDRQVAYEARKGSDSNCFDVDGNRMRLAQAFCELTGEDSCTIEEVDLPA